MDMKDIRIDAKLVKSDEKVRLSWHVQNQSRKRIVLVGYHCPFKRNGEELGVWLQTKKTWMQKVSVIRTNHFRTTLDPEESRTFEWGLVDPSYYGITEQGIWSYRVCIFYYYAGSDDINNVCQESNSIDISGWSDYDRRYFDENTLKLLKSEFPTIRSLREGMSFKDVLFSHKASRVIDAVFMDSKRIILVELDNYLTVEDITRVEETRRKVEQFYGRQMGLDTIVVLIANPPSNEVKRIIADYGTIKVLFPHEFKEYSH